MKSKQNARTTWRKTIVLAIWVIASTVIVQVAHAHNFPIGDIAAFLAFVFTLRQ